MASTKSLTILKDVLIRPRYAISEIGKNGKLYFFVAIGIFLAGSIFFGSFGFEKVWFESFVGEPFQTDVAAKIVDIEIAIFLGFFYVVLVYYIGQKCFKGKGNFIGMFSTFQYAGFPLLIFGVPAFFIIETMLGNSILEQSMEGMFRTIYIGALITVPFFIWSVVLTILACKKIHQFNVKRTIATMLVSLIILLIVSSVIESLILLVEHSSS